MAEMPRFRFTPRTRKNMDEVFMALGERAHTLTVAELAAFAAQFITSDGTVAQVADLAAAAATTYQALAEKGQPDGYAELDGSGDVPDGQIPSSITRDSELTAAIADFIARTIVDAAGDLIVGSGVDTVARLAKGADDTQLTVDPTTHLLVWQAKDGKAKVSSADTTRNYLEDKIVAGSNVTVTKLNTGANEQLSIASSGGGGSALTVKELDGAPLDAAVTIIQVPNGGLVDNGVGDVTIDPPTKDHNHTAAAGDGGDLDGAVIGDFLELTEVSAPSTPASGFGRLYVKTTGIFFKGDDGVEIGPLGAAGGSGPSDLIIIEDQRASGTASGSLATGSWVTRPLNTEVVDTGNHASVSANQFVLAAGTYRFKAWGETYNVARHNMRLQNITDAVTTLNGSSAYANGDTSSPAFVEGRFTIAGSKTFELQHRVETTSGTFGFGVPSGTSFTVDHEVFTRIVIEKE